MLKIKEFCPDWASFGLFRYGRAIGVSLGLDYVSTCGIDFVVWMRFFFSYG